MALPGITTSVRLTRGEFDDMLRPAIGETVAATRRVLESAGVEPGDLSAIVLVGGSSRIPLVSEMLSAAFGRPLALDNHPKHDVALGAAIRGTPAAQPRGRLRPATAPAADRGGRGAAAPPRLVPRRCLPHRPRARGDRAARTPVRRHRAHRAVPPAAAPPADAPPPGPSPDWRPPPPSAR